MKRCILSRYVLRYIFQCKVIVKPLNRDWFFLHMYKIYIGVRIYLKILQFVCCFLESRIYYLVLGLWCFVIRQILKPYVSINGRGKTLKLCDTTYPSLSFLPLSHAFCVRAHSGQLLQPSQLPRQSAHALESQSAAWRRARVSGR